VPDETNWEALLREGATAWNEWRKQHPDDKPRKMVLARAPVSLSGFDLTRVDLSGTALRGSFAGADLRQARMGNSDYRGTDLSGADLRKADLSASLVSSTKFRGADLRDTSFMQCIVQDCDFSGADLCGANLSATVFVRCDFTGAQLDDARVYGVSAWDLKLDGASQKNLVVTKAPQPTLTVDHLEVAQFLYLLINNSKLREVVDTLASKTVLILGRFSPPERKAALDTVRDGVRARGYVPLMFDFEPSAHRNLTETIQLLAGMARFVVADLTDAKSVPQELSTIVPHMPSVPVQPILLASQKAYAMFEHFQSYAWVLPDFLYQDNAHLSASLDQVIIPAEQRLAGGYATSGDALGVMRQKVETQAIELQQAQAQIEALRAELASRTR
jgi:uncharacterized protein YjbI with pentapeptide repeats